MLLRSITFTAFDLYKESLHFVTNHKLLMEGTRVSWPQEWTDQLFSPPRDFDKRRRARRFLKWAINAGVTVDTWLDKLESGQDIEAPPAIGGGVGRAYMLDDKVIKFTTDTTEAKIANALVGKDVPNLTKFHSVAHIEGLGNRKIYAIISDRVPNRIPKKYRIAANAVYNYLDAYNRPIINVKVALQEIMANQRFLPTKYRSDKDIELGIYKILDATDAVFRATGILLQDPHGGNVLMKGRDIHFFDVGRSSDLRDKQDESPITNIT